MLMTAASSVLFKPITSPTPSVGAIVSPAIPMKCKLQIESESHPATSTRRRGCEMLLARMKAINPNARPATIDTAT